MIRFFCISAACLVSLASVATALDLSLPANATLAREKVSDQDSYALPTAPWDGTKVPNQMLEGQVTTQVWRIPAQGITTLQILTPLREQLASAGYETQFECETDNCGGFDFRFETPVLPAPDMHVDLMDYRFLTARKDDGDHLSLMISRSAKAGFVQLIRVTDAGTTAQKTQINLTAPTVFSLPGQDQPIAQALVKNGHVILSDLAFETGSSTLGKGPFNSLEALAAFLQTDPSLRIALVGHTDSVGSLEGNIALSKRRATAVKERLATAYGIPKSQMDAQGMGYLAPVAPNQNDKGREANRRVEAILLNTK